jgi:hypothetical protein
MAGSPEVRRDDAPGEVSSRRRSVKVVASLVLNAVVPVVAYTVVRPYVGTDLMALLIASAIPVVVTAALLVVRRRLDPIGVVSVVGFGIALLVQVLSHGNALAFELQDPVLTALVALACLGSVVIGKPLHLVGVRMLARTNTRVARMLDDPDRFRSSTIVTVVVGVMTLAHAVAIAFIALTLPVSDFLAVSRPVGWAILGVGVVWTWWYRRRRHAARDEALRHKESQESEDSVFVV